MEKTTKSYSECSNVERLVIEDMAQILCDPDTDNDEKNMALNTLLEAIENDRKNNE